MKDSKKITRRRHSAELKAQVLSECAQRGPDEVGNLQPLCQSHHNVKTAAEAEKRVRGV